MAPFDNSDLRITLAISQQEAQTGTSRTLTHPNGRLVTITVPAGTYSGQEIRLEGQGLPTPDGRNLGAFIVTIVITPEEKLDPFFSPQKEANIPTEIRQVLPPPPPASSYLVGDSPPYMSQTPAYTQYPPEYIQRKPYAPPQTKTRSTGTTILQAACAFLVIAVGILAYYAVVYQPNQLRAQVLATVRAQITKTAIAGVPATARAQVNATQAAVKTAQTLYDQVTNSAPALNDTMQEPNANNWDSGTICAYQGGAYYATQSAKNSVSFCLAESSHFSNFAYQVQMQILQGISGGIIFRADGINAKFYLFRISLNGRYDLLYYPDLKGQNIKTLAQGVTYILNNRNTINVAVIAHKGILDLYINGVYLTSASDPSLTSGQIGVVADNTGGADGVTTSVAYTLVQVWRL